MHACYLSCSWDRLKLYIEKKKFFSLILLIQLVELTNQKRGIGRQSILYPLWLRPLFPNDVEILEPKVGFGPNQIEI